ncbi:MAG: major facilitator superfamily domain-containing protein [Linnemannia elongata]|nr:MAG: major facilitator superfamily domain-containing protein [Linnemannia elongata]
MSAKKSTTKTGSRPTPAVAPSSNSSASPESVPKVTRIVFTALLLDILAFTIILPLFPRLLQFYRDSEHGDQTSLLAWSLSRLTEFQSAIGLNDAKTPSSSSIKRPPKMDIVLLGGALGSLFSVLQFIASPVIGKLSDILGRRRVLLISMLGNLISCGVWLFSSTFELFVLSRIIGGLSEGNVQLSIAMISDITTPATRSKGLAMVGIAFAIAFTIGPALGAYFANKDLVAAWPWLAQYGLHPFSGSALLALVLLTVESLYLYAKLPETNSESWRLAVQQTVQQETTDASGSSSSSTPVTHGSTATTKSASTSSSPTAALDQEKIQSLQQSYLSVLSFTHFAHLFLFSGMEFTLTFLTFHLFDFSHMQQGALLGYIGILSSLLQGGYVRRRAHIVGEKRMVLQGMVAAALGLGSIALVSGGGGATTTLLGEKSVLFPGYVIDAIEWLDTQEWSRKTRMWGLYAGATGLAVTSATVVNCLTSLASLVCDMGSNDSLPTPTSTSSTTTTKKQPIGKGLALGRFRSWGQLGRAAGPIAACSLYWRVGPLVCYGAASAAVFAIAFLASRILPEVRKLPIRTRAAAAASSKKTK